MNMDNLDQGTLGPNVPEFGPPVQRGWWSRNWLWFVPTLLLAMIVLCCGFPLGFVIQFYRALDPAGGSRRRAEYECECRINR